MSAKDSGGCLSLSLCFTPGCSSGLSLNKGAKRPSSGDEVSSLSSSNGAGRPVCSLTLWWGSLLVTFSRSSSSSEGSKTKEFTRTSISRMGWGFSPRRTMILLRLGESGFSPPRLAGGGIDTILEEKFFYISSNFSTKQFLAFLRSLEHLTEPAFESDFALHLFPRDIFVQRNALGRPGGNIFLQLIDELLQFLEWGSSACSFLVSLLVSFRVAMDLWPALLFERYSLGRGDYATLPF
ncbi:hypothetical protein Taro_001960 [Colocasia esculenta]|uniref:Uncharacterized protein n=1 Tax=Colocasia esculenta TaxID=4460 RepID=A0A843TF53_COLES|nr:hypothetical protein [Colocasia esculenta]